MTQAYLVFLPFWLLLAQFRHLLQTLLRKESKPV